MINSLYNALLYQGSYPAMWLLLPFWIWSVWRLLQKLMRGIPKAGGIALLAFVVTLITFRVSTPDFRILGDETNYLSLSFNLWKNHSIRTPFMGHWSEGRFLPLLEVLDRRPLFFPFCISLVHTVFGYAPHNSFITNAIFLFVLLFTVFLMVRRRFSSASLIGLALLLLCQPLWVAVVTSGGIDLLSNLIFLLVLLSAREAWREPSQLFHFWIQLIVLIQTRHEGVIYLIAFPILCVLRKAPLPNRKMLALYAFTGLLMVPRVLQLFETRYDIEEGPLATVLSVKHLLPNVGNLLQTLLHLGKSSPFAASISWGVLLAGVLGERRRKIQWRGVAVLFPLVIPLFYKFGQASEPVSARYFLWLVLAMAYFVFYLSEQWNLSQTKLKLAILFVFFWEFQMVPDHRFISELVAARSLRDGKEVLSQENPHATLLISEAPEWWVPFGYSSMSFTYFNAKEHEITQRYREIGYQKIIKIEKLEFIKTPPALGSFAGKPFQLVLHRQVADDVYLRFSEVAL